VNRSCFFNINGVYHYSYLGDEKRLIYMYTRMMTKMIMMMMM